ncbi:MAG: ATP-binding protein [Mycobacteriales bacterium]
MQPPTLRSINLAGTAESVGQARFFVQECCALWGLTEATDVAVLIASELATNAVRYARSPVILWLGHRPDRLVLSVEDLSAASPAVREPQATDEGGRGLVLVDALAQRWGETHLEHGKRVWAEIALAPVSAPD